MSKTPPKLVKSDEGLKTPNKSNAAKTKTPSSKRVTRGRKRTTETSATNSVCETPVEIFLEDTDGEENGSAHNGRRRSNRIRYPNKQFVADFVVKTDEHTASNRKRILPQNEETDLEIEEAEDTEEGSDIMVGNVSKPNLADLKLLEEDLEMAGKLVFGFNTPKKKGRMAEVAMNTPKTPGNTPKTPKTPSALCKTPESKRAKRTILPKTPSHLRNKVKTQIAKLMADSGSDFSADDSDFSPSESESSSSDCEEVDNDVDDEPKTPHKRRRPIIVPILPKTPSAARLRQSSRNKKNTDFVPECESYFQSHSSNKIFTSDHTLDRLKNPRLPADRLFSLLAKMKISPEHEDSINAIMEEYKSYFPKWLYILNEGFNILLYGLGSKRQLLQSFHRSVLSNQPVIVINGFFPSLTIKDILDSITNDILDADICSSNPHEAVDMIEEEFSLIPQTHLYLIVHNLEGTMLRSSKVQSILARLAKVPNIHMLASVDHINTPLLWDHTKLSNFNFSWWDCTTMLPYSDETAFENSLLVQNSGELALSSMRSVFSALTTNARGIYLIIVKHQLKNKGNTNYQGISFQDLYWRCREAFLVSSDLALRAQLTEFLDHKLAKSKRSVDGNEQLTIPIDASLLQQFLDEHEK